MNQPNRSIESLHSRPTVPAKAGARPGLAAGPWTSAYDELLARPTIRLTPLELADVLAYEAEARRRNG